MVDTYDEIRLQLEHAFRRALSEDSEIQFQSLRVSFNSYHDALVVTLNFTQNRHSTFRIYRHQLEHGRSEASILLALNHAATVLWPHTVARHHYGTLRRLANEHMREALAAAPDVAARQQVMFDHHRTLQAIDDLCRTMFDAALASMPARTYAGFNDTHINHEQYVEAKRRAKKLLMSSLSKEQRAEYKKTQSFVVIGSDTGRRYAIRYGKQMNVDELHKGSVMCGWCFTPEGGLVEEDCMLAQKIALETQENKTLKIANRIWGARPGAVARWFDDDTTGHYP